MKFYTISYCKFEKTFEVYPRLFTKRKDAEEFCVFLRSSGHSNVKITICTLQCKYATGGTSAKMPSTNITPSSQGQGKMVVTVRVRGLMKA